MKMFNEIYRGFYNDYEGLLGSTLIEEKFLTEDVGKYNGYFFETYRSRKGYIYKHSWRTADGCEGRLDEMLYVYKPIHLKERMRLARRVQRLRKKVPAVRS